jgi:Protein of unknown function (DUF2726)
MTRVALPTSLRHYFCQGVDDVESADHLHGQRVCIPPCPPHHCYPFCRTEKQVGDLLERYLSGNVTLDDFGDAAPHLSANETAFYHCLQKAVGEQYIIFPQLPLWVFLERRSQSKAAERAFTNQINLKRVDFVLVDPQDLRVHLAIEVDDRSHAAEHRRRRDGFVESVLQQAGITLVRIPAAHSYAVSTLRQQLGLLDDQSETRKTAASF